MDRKEIAKILLEKNAVTLDTQEPYTYSSGIRSPIYCDNRYLAAFPDERKKIVQGFLDIVKEMEFDIVGGTSTAGIQWAAWIAHELEKPMCYIRGSAKKHGKGKQIEGAPAENQKVLVIEDLISTGGSSLEAVDAVKDNGGNVIAVVAIFTYGLQAAEEKLAGYKVETLTDFPTLAQTAKEEGYISQEQLEVAQEWNQDPKEWGPKHGFPNVEK